MREQRALADTPLELAQLAQHRNTFAEQSKQPDDTLVDDCFVAEEVWFPFPGRRQQLEPMLRLVVADCHLCQDVSWSRDVPSKLCGFHRHPTARQDSTKQFGTWYEFEFRWYTWSAFAREKYLLETKFRMADRITQWRIDLKALYRNSLH